MAIKIFYLWTFILISRPQDFFPLLNDYRLALISTVLTLLVTIISRGPSVARIFSVKGCKVYLLFYLIMFMGIPFALYRRIAFEFILFTYLVNVIFFILVIHYVDSVIKLKYMMFVLLLCSLFYTVSNLIGGSFTEGRFFSYGEMHDPNDIAYILIALLPMTMIFMAFKIGFVNTFLSLLTTAISILVIMLTGSRSGFISLITCLIVSCVVFRKNIKLSHVLYFILLVIIFIGAYKDQINVERYLTLKNIQSDYNVTDESGRVQIWSRGIRVFTSNIFTGIGVNCFPEAIGNLRQSEDAIPRWQTAHNSYLQIAAEMGIFGIIIYLYMIIYCIKSILTVRDLEKTTNNHPEINKVAGLLLIGMVSVMVNSFFLSQAYSLLMTLYFAMCGALKNIYDNIVLEKTDLSLQSVAHVTS